ncbi:MULTISPECIES: hemolysin expression modulator Hha [Serratia]|uniref:hemolysin expression modulator Hha n=1 Tax=Serratia TaxID=613 RepID=UPI001602151B|nr:hemolysin expression modulator Hha [Serratia sp. OS31]MBB1584605.1 hemolysin expression modulator Hha [Serratia sp. OS31]
MTKQEYLMRLRRCRTRDTLEKIIEKKNNQALPAAELAEFLAAADHRLAELITGKLFDRVPKGVWSLVY